MRAMLVLFVLTSCWTQSSGAVWGPLLESAMGAGQVLRPVVQALRRSYASAAEVVLHREPASGLSYFYEKPTHEIDTGLTGRRDTYPEKGKVAASDGVAATTYKLPPTKKK